MRIGIITFFQSQDNYGQLLQCYALQRTLRDMGHKAYLIRYGFHEVFFHWIKKNNFMTKHGLQSVKKQLKKQFGRKKLASERCFDSFRDRYIERSFRTYNSLSELRHHPPKADCYIAGSDQVWAQLLSIENNRSFFLDFGPSSIKRVSYAPSFALVNYPDELKSRLAEQLSKFDAISVREQSGVDICRSVGFEANLVLDPSLLVCVSIYEKMMKRPSFSNYCFVYHVNLTSKEELFWDRFHSYNKNSGLASVATFANPTEGVNMELLDGANYVYPTIESWLGLVHEAEYVLTSSFHGLVFSILFHKPFVVCLRREGLFAGNDRVMTMLEMFDLEDRVVKSETQDIDAILSKPIDWAYVDAVLDQKKKESFAFLKNALKNESTF